MSGRRDPTARDAIHTAAADPTPPIPLGPDCANGKHHACPGDTWDPTGGGSVDCPCPCHDAGGWGQPHPTRHEPRTHL